jgi:hypothetical protein
MPSLVAVHEAAHVAAARSMGLTVASTAVHDGDGVTAIAHDRTSPMHLAGLALAAAAAPVLHERAGIQQFMCNDDFARVKDHCEAYTALTGRVLDVWSLARSMMRLPHIGAQVLALAAALDTRGGLSSADIDAICGPFDPPAAAQPAPVAEAADLTDCYAGA